MKITIKDPFGTVVGHALIEWDEIDYSSTLIDGPKNVADQAGVALIPEQWVRLNAKNPNMPWLMEIVV